MTRTASTASGSTRARPGVTTRDPDVRIAGRRDELDVVRRHLETGTGLLLVTGEAGMGKTTLIEAACAEVHGAVLLALGRCLPFSTEVPLLPVAEALRHVTRAEDGGLVAAALERCPAYVREAMSAVLPEWSTDAPVTDPDDRWLRQRLFAGVAELCRALSTEQPFALVLEDLHWADDLTLDLVEHLLRHGEATILGSWRTDDPEVSEGHRDWLGRLRRDAEMLPLDPLTADETQQQLRLLTTRGIRRRTRHGSHDAAVASPCSPSSSPTPRPVSPPTSTTCWTGGSAPVRTDVGGRVRARGRGPAARGRGHRTGLRGRARAAHRRPARSARSTTHRRRPSRPAAASPAARRGSASSSAARVRRPHSTAPWRGSWPRPRTSSRPRWPGTGSAPGSTRRSCVWQVRAARAAAERYSGLQAAAHWRRALALWPSGAAEAGEPPVRRHEVVAGIATQLDLAGRPRDAAPVLEAELALTDPPHLYDVAERADLLRQLARLNSSQFVGGSLGLQMIEHAIDLYRTLDPTPGLATALTWKGTELEWGGRRTEATDVLAEAAAVVAGTGDRLLERSVLAQWAWQLAASGDAGSVDEIDRITRTFGQDESPLRNLWVAVRHTDILLMACRPAEDVARAARPALDQAARWQITGGHADILKSNVAQAWRRAGKVGRAMEVVGDETRAEEPGTLVLPPRRSRHSRGAPGSRGHRAAVASATSPRAGRRWPTASSSRHTSTTRSGWATPRRPWS